MAQSINVGKNVAVILGHEFPIDADLNLDKWFDGQRAWRTENAVKTYPFTPIIDGNVSAATFLTYDKALHESIAFNRRGKMRQLFEKKEEGVKIVPGHGVFILPSKMTVVRSGQRHVKIRVFSGTEHSAEFVNKDYKQMVLEAANHYYKHLREHTDSVNDNLWYPVKYRRTTPLVCNGFEIPDGVRVYTANEGKSIEVHYTSIEENKAVYLGTARNAHELGKMLNTADRIRQKEQQAAAVYRYVNPSFVQLSQYMRRI